MGLRIWHRFRVAPGITLNISNGGPSVSLGVRGAHFTVGRGGTRTTVGIPGTGVFYTEAHPYRGGGTPMTVGRAIGNVLLGLMLAAVVLGLIALFGCEPSTVSSTEGRMWGMWGGGFFFGLAIGIPFGCFVLGRRR